MATDVTIVSQKICHQTGMWLFGNIGKGYGSDQNNRYAIKRNGRIGHLERRVDWGKISPVVIFSLLERVDVAVLAWFPRLSETSPSKARLFGIVRPGQNFLCQVSIVLGSVRVGRILEDRLPETGSFGQSYVATNLCLEGLGT